MKVLLPAACVLLLAGGYVFAQDSGSAGGVAAAEVVQALEVKEVNDLDFGRIVQGPAGSVTISEINGSVSIMGDLAHLGGARAGLFEVTAAPGTDVSVFFQNPEVTLKNAENAADTMTAELFVDIETAPTDMRGIRPVSIGGTLNIEAGQPAGLYSAEFTLTAQY
jgi:hypothetical protein